MEAFYFLYGPFPLFTGVSGSQTSRKLNFRFTEFSEVPSIEEGGLGLLLKAPASAFER